MMREGKSGIPESERTSPLFTGLINARASPILFSIAHLIVDALMLFLGFSLAYLIRFKSGLPVPLGRVPYSSYLILWLISLPIWWLVFAYHGLYFSRLKDSFSSELSRLPSAVSLSIILTIIVSFAVRGLPESRLTFIFQFVFSFLLIVVGRRILRYLTASPSPSIFLLGDSPIIEILKFRLRRRYGKNAKVFLFSEEDLRLESLEFQDAERLVREKILKEKPLEVIAVNVKWKELTDALMMIALNGSTRVRFMPAGESLFLGSTHLSSEYGFPEICPKIRDEIIAISRAKRAFDIIIGSLIFILVLPLMSIIAFLIWLTSPGPVFFVHKRSGAFGKEFKLLKFRTMYESASLPSELQEQFLREYKLKDDPRITPLGKWLRRLSLDELPQLINVLKGEMSLVGPRPIVKDELEKYGVWKNVLLILLPGLTGLWQVSGRSELSYEERVDLDIYYIMNWNPALDFSILLRTLVAILSGRGAY